MAEKKFRSVEEATSALVAYARERGLIGEDDITYVTNMLFDALKYQPTGAFIPKVGEARASEHTRKPSLESILSALLDYAVEHELIDGGIASRDLFDTRLMGCVTPRPSEVTREFWRRYEESPKAATDYLYRLALDSDYIRSYRIVKDRKWVTKTPYGKLDITINLSKPEKDPKAIAAALKKKSGDEPYPRCQLCPENVGYAGRLDHPARETIRLIPLTLAGEKWYLQYSPYVYYNEHCIVLSERHVPMKINTTTFVRLLEFIEKFPHYTVGSNADLPIVGGSILTHEHYQGGCYEFAMARADLREKISFAGFDDVEAGIVNWPMSVIRLDAADPARLVTLADKILTAWRRYSDESVGVLAVTDDTPHNTITPIARRRGEGFELDLAPVPKVLPLIRTRCGVVIGFKAESGLTHQELTERARSRLELYDLAAVVANDIDVVGKTSSSAILVTRDDAKDITGTKAEVSDAILDYCVKRL